MNWIKPTAIIAAIIIVVALLIIIPMSCIQKGTRISHKNQVINAKTPDQIERENTIALIKLYVEKGEYDRAMNLLDGLLIKDANE